MPGLSNPAMVVGANAIRLALAYAQLNWAAAGDFGTDNPTIAARQPILWGPVTGDGDFNLASPLNFSGGAPNSAVYSVTIWSASSAGTFYGEFILSGDQAFNSLGNYVVNAINLDGSASWSGAPGSGDDTASVGNIILPNFGKIPYPILPTMHRVLRPRRRK